MFALSDRALHGLGVGHGPPEKIKKLTTIGLFCETFNNFSTVIVFRGFKSGIRDFCNAYTHVPEACRLMNLHEFQISRILSYCPVN